MTSDSHIVRKETNSFTRIDTRIIMLLMLCLAIGLNSWLYSRPVHKLSSPDTNHQVKWVHNSLVITTGEMNPAKHKLPARIAPFYFKKININQADSALLQIIPGSGPEFSKRILAERDKQGGFHSAEQLLSVSGIGYKRKEKLTQWLDFE